MILYKLVDQDYYTRRDMPGETQWAVGRTVEATGAEGQPLCTDGWLHAYEDPFLAILHNPVHADIGNPRMLEIEAEIGIRDNWMKCGVRQATVLREIAPPQITTIQHVAYGILCGLAVVPTGKWARWARRWLSGEDRSAEAAITAAIAAAMAPAGMAARAAAEAAAAAAEAAASLATLAAPAAALAATARSAEAAAWSAAAGSAGAAAWSAAAGSAGDRAKRNLPNLVRQAMEIV